MARRSRFGVCSTDQYRAFAVTEAHVLATLREYAEAAGGFTRHIRDARGQDLVGVADCLLWVPAEDRSRTVFGMVEAKIGADPESAQQRIVRAYSERIGDGVVAAVCREGRDPGPGETDLDGVIARLEDARRWP